jgi:hypothetical protein
MACLPSLLVDVYLSINTAWVEEDLLVLISHIYDDLIAS